MESKRRRKNIVKSTKFEQYLSFDAETRVEPVPESIAQALPMNSMQMGTATMLSEVRGFRPWSFDV